MYKMFFSVLALLMSFSAQAALLGSSVSVCADSAYNSGSVTANPAVCASGSVQPTPTSAIITEPGVEFSMTNSGTRTLDFTNDTLTISYDNVGSSSPDLFVFEFDDAVSTMTLISLNLLNITTMIDGKFLGVLVSAPSVDSSVTFQFGTTEVPVPAALWLFVSGLLGLTAVRRRKA